ncbi:MAG: hypothetical protein JXQ67_10890 [Campylobacterales bacterium]|nr:hypothetical protein [Campylobacterales bacterium]
MIKCHQKFENLEEELTDLKDVLKNSLQKEVLEIKQLSKESQKFQDVSKEFPQLRDAEYVIYSAFMCKDFHESESFIFIDAKGKTVCTLTGRDLDLYEMIKKCENLKESEDYS